MNVQQVDEFVPNYERTCVVCGTGHVVSAVRNQVVMFTSELCGVCTWGDADMINPDNWNSDGHSNN